MKKVTLNTNETLIVNLTNKVTELEEIRSGQVKIMESDLTRIEKLKKQLTILEQRIYNLKIKNKSLERKNEELKAQNKDLCESLDIMNNRESELLEQIDEMKNVGNCKNAMKCAKWNEKQTILGCMKFCKNCKEWELVK